jgi:hypothetical protein
METIRSANPLEQRESSKWPRSDKTEQGSGRFVSQMPLSPSGAEVSSELLCPFDLV